MSTPETKTIKTRFQLKNDTPANWATASQNNFIPLQGEPILYKDGTSGEIYGMKVGDGTHTPDNLDFICDNTQTIVVDSALSSTSENPVQNKVITAALAATGDPTIILTVKATYSTRDAIIHFSGITSVDWGDGTINNSTSHRYSTSSSATFIVKVFGNVSFDNNWSYSCFSENMLKEVVIGNTITSIGKNAFKNCTILTSVTIPNSVTSIGQSAFQGCTSLTGITIPNSVTSIGSQAFYQCYIKNITIPAAVTSIGSYGFYGGAYLQKVVFEGTTSPTIGSNAFTSTNNCPIYVPLSALTTYKTSLSAYASRVVANATTGYDIGAIKGTPTILKIELPSSPITVGFWNTVSCTYIDWGDGTITDGSTFTHSYSSSGTKFIMIYGVSGVTGDMGEPWFSTGYQYLTEVTLGSTVESVGNISFTGCTALKNVVFPEGLASIDYNAFYGCTALKNVKLPSTLASMADGAFNDCSNLEVAEFLGRTPPASLMDTPMDPLFPSSTTLIVPTGTTSAYNTAFGSLACAYTFTEYSLGGGGGGGGATWHYVGAASVTVSLTGACSVFTVCFRGGDAPSYDYFGTSTVTIVNSADPLEIRGTADGYGQYATAYGSNFDPDTSTYTEAVISVSSGATIQGYFSY